MKLQNNRKEILILNLQYAAPSNVRIEKTDTKHDYYCISSFLAKL